MTVQHVLSVSAVLCVVTACVPQNQNQIAPKSGPKARIYATYSGGLSSRTAQAHFRSESNAYAMVGHLGGDGYIRILYPKTANDRGAIKGKETYSTSMINAQYDGAPEIFFARQMPYRNVSTRLDSYDGQGFGYFFVVTSRYPLEFASISDGMLFDEIEVPDFYDDNDPRLTIRALADLVSGGNAYTLDFASSFGSHAYASSFAENRFDCAMLAARGFAYALYTPYSYGLFNRNVYGRAGCRSRQYAYDAYQTWLRRQYAMGYTPGTPTATLPIPTTETKPGTVRPPWQRRVTPRRTTPRRAATAASTAFGRSDNGAVRRSGVPQRTSTFDDDRRRRSPSSDRISTSSGAGREARPARAEPAAERSRPVERSQPSTPAREPSAPRERKDP
jgi:hypothetical protein